MLQLPSLRRLFTLIGVALVLAVTGFATENPLQDAIVKMSDYRSGLVSLNLPNNANAGLPGSIVTLLVRFRTSSENVTGGLTVLRDSARNTLFSLGLEQVDGAPQLQFALRTDRSDIPLRLGVPIDLIGAARWHTVIARYAGPKIDLFVDGVLVDEEWPMGMLRPQGATVLEIGSPAYPGEISAAALWKRRLSDAEVVSLSGGPAEISLRTREYLGVPSNQLQYWKPQGWNTSAGDTMPMFENGTFHVYYLFDRRHHHSKWGLGAHQWAHVSSTDLIHWKQQPMALPITDESEGSICTGSVFCRFGKYYAFYATRKPDRSEQLGVALSDDGIHFSKVLPTPFSEPESPYRRGPNRDPFVFFDQTSGRYKMLVTAELASPLLSHRGGALELLESPDLKQWKARKPFLVPGNVGAQPECSDLFRWNNWYYLLFGQDGATHYRMSREANGPWLTPAADILDDPRARVMKTAAFKDGRRIGVAFVAEKGYAGNLIFRELVQHPDSTLGTKFPPEMSLAAGDPIVWRAKPLTPGAIVNGQSVTIQPKGGFGVVSLDKIPQNVRLSLTLRPSNTATAFGVTLRGKGNYEGGVELRLEPFRHRVSWRAADAKSLDEDPLTSIYQVAGLNQPVNLEIIAKGSIFDVCINGRRTAIHRAAAQSGDQLFLFAAGGEVTVDRLEIRPLR